MDGSFSLSERERDSFILSSRFEFDAFQRRSFVFKREIERERERERERETRGVREFSGGGKVFRRYTRGVGIRVHDKKKKNMFAASLVLYNQHIGSSRRTSKQQNIVRECRGYNNISWWVDYVYVA